MRAFAFLCCLDHLLFLSLLPYSYTVSCGVYHSSIVGLFIAPFYVPATASPMSIDFGTSTSWLLSHRCTCSLTSFLFGLSFSFCSVGEVVTPHGADLTFFVGLFFCLFTGVLVWRCWHTHKQLQEEDEQAAKALEREAAELEKAEKAREAAAKEVATKGSGMKEAATPEMAAKVAVNQDASKAGGSAPWDTKPQTGTRFSSPRFPR